MDELSIHDSKPLVEMTLDAAPREASSVVASTEDLRNVVDFMVAMCCGCDFLR